MAPKIAHRRQELEKLESRHLLAGNVTAAVVDGSLLIDGDELGNELTLTQVWGPDLQEATSSDSVAYKVTPSDDTTINGGRPGEPVFVSGITEDIAMDLGGGNDLLEVYGVPGGPVVANMRIRTAAGADAVTIGNFATSKDVLILNSSGADKYSLFATRVGGQLSFDGGPDGAGASLSEMTVGSRVDEPTTDLFQPALSSLNTQAEIDFVEVAGDSVMKYKNVQGALKWNKAHILGDLHVSTDSGLNASITKSSVEGNAYFKLEHTKIYDDSLGEINMDQASVSGNVNVSSAGPLDLLMNDVHVGGGQYIAYKLKNVLISSYQLNAGSTDGDVTVTSQDGQPEVLLNGTQVGGSVSLKLRGTGTTDRYRAPVKIVKTNIRGVLTAVVKNQTDVSIDESVIGSGLHVKLGTTDVKPVPANLNVGEFYLKNSMLKGEVNVRTNQPYNVEISDSEVDSRLSVQLGNTAKPVPANLPIGKFFLKNSMLKGELNVRASQPYDVVVNGGEMHKNALIRYAGDKNFDPSTSSIIVDKSTVLGSFTARNDNDVPMESVSINFTKIGTRCAILAKKVGGEGGLPAQYNINATEIGGDLVITTGQTRVRDKNGRGYRDDVPGSSIIITETMVGGNVSMRGGSGSDKIQLTEFKVGGFTRVGAGAGDDYLQIVDSVFAGPALLDGGAGTDTLVLLGDNEFASRRLFRNWEEIIERPDNPNVD